MKSFKEFLNNTQILQEMGIISGDNDYNNYSKEYDWNKFYKGKEVPILLLKDIGSNHLRLYLVGNSHFYLADGNNNYKGQLELVINNHIGTIQSSNSVLERGFYNIMFTSIFATGLVKEILSDINLSTQAIKSYDKLYINGYLDIQVYNTKNNTYYPFSIDTFKSNTYNVISIREKQYNSIKEHFEEYYKRINSIEVLESGNIVNFSFRTEFLKNSTSLDNYLFCEYFM